MFTTVSGGLSMSESTHERAAPAAPEEEVLVIPLVAEQARLHVRRVETGSGVRVHTTVSERVEEIDALLRDETVQVERRESGRVVPADQAPAAHYEGDTLVLPVLEEVLVTEKRVRIKEELRITRIPTERRHRETVVLKTEQAVVERFGEENENRGGGAQGTTDNN
jgi:stress response protein YsnF